MSRDGGLLNPVKLSDDETEIVRKRESLRLRGLAWAALFWWVLALVVGGVCISIERANARVAAVDLVNGLILILFVTVPLVSFYIMLVWWSGVYTLGTQRVCRRSDLPDALRSMVRRDAPGALDIDCMDVTRVSVKRLHWPARRLDIGHVIVDTRSQAQSLVLPYMEHPKSLADEIMGYSLGSEEGTENQAAPRVLRRSGVWLVFWEGLLLTVLWVCAAFWFELKVVGAYGADIMFAIVLIASLATAVYPFPRAIIEFLNWWVRVYVVTNRRVVAHSGVLNVTERVLSLDDVVSASATKSGLARYLGMGDVQVNTAGPTGVVKMVNISEPDWVRQQVLALQKRIQRSRQQIEVGEIRRRLTQTLHL